MYYFLSLIFMQIISMVRMKYENSRLNIRDLKYTVFFTFLGRQAESLYTIAGKMSFLISLFFDLYYYFCSFFYRIFVTLL